VNDKPSWKKFDCLFEGEVQVSLINQPAIIDEPKAESATARALRVWFKHDPTLVEGKAHDR
jgi:hypothetical protein